MPQTVGCVLHSTPQNVYVAEDQPRCPTRLPLSRSAVLPCPPSLAARLGIRYSPMSVHVTYEFRDVRKLTFLSVTDTCVRTYLSTYIRTYVHTYIRTYVHTYIHCENRSPIQSLALIRSATSLFISWIVF